MTASPRILVVEDDPKFRGMFSRELKQKMNAEVVAVAYLEDARAALIEAQISGQPFDAIVTDCGFPARAGEEHLRDPLGHIPYNGIKLVGEIRKEQYGKYHSMVPIAFNSAESHKAKGDLAKAHGGLTESFKKGTNYPEFKGIKYQEHTVGNVTAATVKWLTEQLTEEKIMDRKTSAVAAESEVADRRLPKKLSLLNRALQKRTASSQQGVSA